jgi:hypothetical protein
MIKLLMKLFNSKLTLSDINASNYNLANTIDSVILQSAKTYYTNSDKKLRSTQLVFMDVLTGEFKLIRLHGIEVPKSTLGLTQSTKAKLIMKKYGKTINLSILKQLGNISVNGTYEELGS